MTLTYPRDAVSAAELTRVSLHEPIGQALLGEVGRLAALVAGAQDADADQFARDTAALGASAAGTPADLTVVAEADAGGGGCRLVLIVLDTTVAPDSSGHAIARHAMALPPGTFDDPSAIAARLAQRLPRTR